jgi:hypothetical protein
VTRSGTPTRRAVEAAAAPATTITITTGDNRTLGRATATVPTCGRSDAAPETTGKGQTDTHRIAITIPAGPIGRGAVEMTSTHDRTASIPAATQQTSPPEGDSTRAVALPGTLPIGVKSDGRTVPLYLASEVSALHPPVSTSWSSRERSVLM